MKLSDDRISATIKIEGAFNAEQLDDLIRRLALLRADMVPEIPGSLNADSDVLIEDGQSASLRLRQDGGFRLWMRHRGLGWLAWNMDARFARGMAEYIARRTTRGPSIDFIDEQTAKRH